jgi:hypothetical protein
MKDKLKNCSRLKTKETQGLNVVYCPRLSPGPGKEDRGEIVKVRMQGVD